MNAQEIIQKHLAQAESTLRRTIVAIEDQQQRLAEMQHQRQVIEQEIEVYKQALATKKK